MTVTPQLLEAITALEQVREPGHLAKALVTHVREVLKVPMVVLYEMDEDQGQWLRRAGNPSSVHLFVPRRFSLEDLAPVEPLPSHMSFFDPPNRTDPLAEKLAQILGIPALGVLPIAAEDHLRWLIILALPEETSQNRAGLEKEIEHALRILALAFQKAWAEHVSGSRKQAMDNILMYTRTLFQSMDEGLLGQRLVDAVREATEADASFFLRLNETGRLYEVEAAAGVSEKFRRLYKIPMAEVQKIEQSVLGRFFYIEDVQAEALGSPRLLQQEDLRSLFAGIVKVEGQPIGLLGIASKREPKAFSGASKQAVMMWVDLGSILLEHLAELKRQRAQVFARESVFQLTATLLQVHDFASFVENVVPMIADALYAQRVSLIQEEDAGKRYRAYLYNRKTLEFQNFEFTRTQFLAWLEVDEEEFGTLSTGEMKGGAYFKKILAQGPETWYLWIEGIPGPAQPDLRREVCDAIAWQTALGLLQVIHAEREKHRREELQFLYDLSLQATASLNLHETLPEILQRIRKRFGADHVSLFWLDPESRRLVPMGIAGRSIENPEIRRGIPVGTGMIGSVARTGQPAVVSDVEHESQDLPLLHTTRSKLCVPLQARGETVGVLNLESDQPGQFNEEMLQTLGPLALFLGAFLENARLFQETVETLKKLQTTRNKLMESSKLAAIGSLAAGVAHEISNPLMIIQGYTEFHLNDTELPEPLRRDLRRVKEATERASNIIRSLLEYARSTQEQTVEIVDLNHQIRKTVDIVRKAFSKENVDLALDLDPKLPYTHANKGEINQIIMNLLTNARDAIVESGKKGTITIRTYPQRDQLVLEVEDTGPGIPEHLLEEIFDPFFTTKPPGKGTGLGLAIVQRLVEKMNGTIQVESEVGQGTCFRILLPSVRVEAAKPVQAPMPAAGVPRQPSHRVLVIDDEPDIVDLLRNILETLGQDPVVTSDPVHGLHLAVSEHFDLILLDVKMPTLSGIEIYERLKREAPENAHRVVFITGDVGREEVRKFLEDEQVQYLIKPLSIQDIQTVLEHAVHTARRRRP